MSSDLAPTTANATSMWNLMNQLFPIHRTLVGPGFQESLSIIQRILPIQVHKFPSGMQCLGWTIPKAFVIKAGFVEASNGTHPIDFIDCNYHVWNYSQPFDGILDREELIKHIATRPYLPDAIPLKVTYYRSKWGLSASQKQVDALPPGKYRVHIDTLLYDDFLRIGDYCLPGEISSEILITSYLCHPRGANDNQSGVVLAIELFKLLAQLPKRRYTYRLLIWPEGIGAITYLANFRDRLARTLGGYVVTCVGDSGPLHYKKSYFGNSVFDRAALHALRHFGYPYRVIDFNFSRGSDETYLSGPGIRLPFGSIMRTPYAAFPQYHTSKDDLEFVKPERLLESLAVYWKTIQILEKNRIYEPGYVGLPFLTSYGIYPFWAGAGEGSVGTRKAEAYYHFMGLVDGERDLLAIADYVQENIDLFDRPVAEFLQAKLIKERSML